MNKRVGVSTEPSETPALTGNGWVRTSSIRTEMVRLLRILDVHDTRDGENHNVCRFDRRPSDQTRPKAPEMLRPMSLRDCRIHPIRGEARASQTARSETTLAVVQWSFPLGNRTRLVGDDSFKYFRNNMCGRNGMVVVGISRTTAFRKNHGIVLRRQKGRTFEGKTERVIQKRSQPRGTYVKDDGWNTVQRGWLANVQKTQFLVDLPSANRS